MPTVQTLPSHISGLIDYLSAPAEKANEDLAIAYFRKISGPSFTRQKEAHRADGYLPGSFVLELKAKTSDWLSGFFQALAYKNEGLDFSQIVVAAKEFLVIWKVDDIDDAIREEVLNARGAPNRVGSELSKKNRTRANAILATAVWNGADVTGSLFLSQPAVVSERFSSFEKTLRAGRKVRQKVTPRNFTSVLKEMKDYFDPEQSVKAVRAFYSMVYGWNDGSTLRLSEKASDQATLSGETITNLVPAQRGKFKDFVENRCIHLEAGENVDDFFARYDEALDAVDKDFRIKHGIFFTDLDLSKFVMWLVKRHIPNLGKNYLVIDPACGSGNLVTNWKSPLELRHKVVSEIEPELLFAVEKRMRGDQWHNGKFTVIPKVSENRGLNFLDRSADDYLEELCRYLADKGHKPNRPLAFLCNPPYRSDDDQSATEIGYDVHFSISNVTGLDASSERYCCFLAQMKLICDAARSNGLPDDSLLLVFTKSAWLTKRAMFGTLREQMLGAFENVAGVLVNGSEFFDVKGRWPVAFTLWRYKPKGAVLDAQRSIPLLDLTWLEKDQLARVQWEIPQEMERECQEIVEHPQSVTVELGVDRTSIREWSAETMLDFKRDRRKAEANQKIIGGLPAGDHRHDLKKAHGETDGQFIGFMDDLTLCRVKKSTVDRPWFRLNNQFMDIKKNRCLSGPPTNRGYCAADLDSAKKLFFWYALARSFLQCSYPMSVDADDMWAPVIPVTLESRLHQAAFAIAYAENDCVEARFPANNPVQGVPELNVSNPMTPLSPFSFWSASLKAECTPSESPKVSALIEAVDSLYSEWHGRFSNRSDLPLSRKPYLLDDYGITVGAGIPQIRAYASENDDRKLLSRLNEVQQSLKVLKGEFHELLGPGGLNYFGSPKKAAASAGVARIALRVDHG